MDLFYVVVGSFSLLLLLLTTASLPTRKAFGRLGPLFILAWVAALALDYSFAGWEVSQWMAVALWAFAVFTGFLRWRYLRQQRRKQTS